MLPSQFHTEGLIGNESKQKWREEILIIAVGSPGLFTGALQSPTSTGLGKDPAVWFCAPVLPHTHGVAGTKLVWEALTLSVVTSPISWTHMSSLSIIHPSSLLQEERFQLWAAHLLSGLFNYLSDWQAHCQWSQRKSFSQKEEIHSCGKHRGSRAKSFMYSSKLHYPYIFFLQGKSFNLSTCLSSSLKWGRQNWPSSNVQCQRFQSILKSLNKRHYKRTVHCSCHAAM